MDPWPKIFWNRFFIIDSDHISENGQNLRPLLSKLSDSYRQWLLNKDRIRYSEVGLFFSKVVGKCGNFDDFQKSCFFQSLKPGTTCGKIHKNTTQKNLHPVKEDTLESGIIGPPRLLIFRFFSHQEVFIPTPPFINFV